MIAPGTKSPSEARRPAPHRGPAVAEGGLEVFRGRAADLGRPRGPRAPGPPAASARRLRAAGPRAAGRGSRGPLPTGVRGPNFAARVVGPSCLARGWELRR
ncbi:hypothetical protein GCM10009759_63340 [Kitasatospora saccharophila]|uniref:Uncharacterized protein n=1 Tax=Kitasatospora saccharophila TaxID=407973 RepID=A0ABN2XW36_9ACTN